MVRMRSRLHRVSGDAHISVVPILEADRARKSGSEFTVTLAFGRTRADGCPGKQIGDVSGRRLAEELCARRHTALVHVGNEFPAEPKALVHVEPAARY